MNQTSRVKTQLTLFAIAMVLAMPLSVMAETVNLNVPKKTVSEAFDRAFATTKLSLDNYGSAHGTSTGTSWHQENASVFDMGNGQRITFSIPKFEYLGPVLKIRLWKAYINNFSTQRISAMVSGNKININAAFESQGEEIETRCLKKGTKRKRWKNECAGYMHPNGEINNAQLNILLTPVALNGSVSYAANPGVDFKADIRIKGACSKLERLCDRILDYKPKIHSAVRAGISAQLNQSGIRSMVASQIFNALRTAGVVKNGWKITNISSSGTNFVLRVQRPDQIGKNSVRSLTLKSLAKNGYKNQCPLKVRHTATIRTEYAMNGKVWLENEDGSTTHKIQWNVPSPGKVSSTIERRYKGGPLNKKRKLWSKVVVSYKGVDGKTYTYRSKRAYTNVTCIKKHSGGGGITL